MKVHKICIMVSKRFFEREDSADIKIIAHLHGAAFDVTTLSFFRAPGIGRAEEDIAIPQGPEAFDQQKYLYLVS